MTESNRKLQTTFIPAEQPDSKRLLIMLHGLGDSIEGYRWVPDAFQIPWLNYLLVNAPDPYYGGFSWYDFPGDNKPGVVRSRKLLFELLNDQAANGFPANQITLGGFSQGCLMSIDAGLRYPHTLAGIVGISGYVHEPEKLLKELSPSALHQRLLVTHGLLDPLIPIAGVKQQVAMLKAAGIKIEWHEFAKAHTIASKAEIHIIRDFIQAGYSEPG